MTAAPNREPPAYQEYASTMLANRAYRLMTASERGVLWSMRLECWANHTLPLDPCALAKILGLDAGEVATALPAVMAFFSDETREIRCPELDAYRAKLEDARNAKVEGGKRGADATNKKKRPPKTRAAAYNPAMPAAIPAAMPAAKGRHLSTTQTSQTQSPVKSQGLVADSWVADYVAAENGETVERVKVVI